jgi:hypothetical protein
MSPRPPPKCPGRPHQLVDSAHHPPPRVRPSRARPPSPDQRRATSRPSGSTSWSASLAGGDPDRPHRGPGAGVRYVAARRSRTVWVTAGARFNLSRSPILRSFTTSPISSGSGVLDAGHCLSGPSRSRGSNPGARRLAKSGSEVVAVGAGASSYPVWTTGTPYRPGVSTLYGELGGTGYYVGRRRARPLPDGRRGLRRAEVLSDRRGMRQHDHREPMRSSPRRAHRRVSRAGLGRVRPAAAEAPPSPGCAALRRGLAG